MLATQTVEQRCSAVLAKALNGRTCLCLTVHLQLRRFVEWFCVVVLNVLCAFTMPITRDDIRRQINFDKGMKGQKHVQGSAGDKPGRDLRSKQRGNNPNEERYRLDRLTTKEFDKLLGEGPSPNVVEEKKKLSQQKKTEENLRLQNMCELNKRVLQESDVRNGLQSNDLLSEDDQLEKTVPLEDPTDVVGDDASGANPEEVEQSDKSKQLEVPEQRDSATLENHHHSPTNNNVKQYSDLAVQTEAVTVACWCARCEAIYSGLRQIVNAAINIDCHLCSNSEEASKSPPSLKNILTAVGGQMKHDAPLYMGSTIMLTSTDKSMLKDLSPTDDEPKEFVNLIMDSIYTPEQMANMSAMGRTPGSTKMDPSVFKQMFAYMRHKFKGQEDVVINKSLMVKIINSKCYTMRRQCWEKMRRGDCDSESSVLVRKALPKKTRDVNKPPKGATKKRKETASPRKCEESSLKKKKREKHEQNPKGNEKQTSRKKDKNEKHISEKEKIVIRGSSEKVKDKSLIRGSGEKDNALTPRSSDKDNKTGTRRSSETDKNDRRSNSQNHKSEKHRSSDRAKSEKYRNNETDNKNQKRGSGDQRGHKRFFQWDSVKRNSLALSPRKRTPRKNGGESHKNSFDVSPSQDDMVASSTPRPKFGGKCPKPLEQLLQMNRDVDADEDEEDDEDEESCDEDNEGSDDSRAQTIHSSGSDSEAIQTD